MSVMVSSAPSSAEPPQEHQVFYPEDVVTSLVEQAQTLSPEDRGRVVEALAQGVDASADGSLLTDATAWAQHREGGHSGLVSLLQRAVVQVRRGSCRMGADALGVLLHALAMEAAFGGVDDTDWGVEIDLAKTQYLRAIYELTPLAQRAQTLAREWSELTRVGGEVGLGVLSCMEPMGLPDLEAFLPHWVEVLASADEQEQIILEAEEQQDLLREALNLALQHGVLQEVVQGKAARCPVLYLEWIAVLEAHAQWHEALSAAQWASTVVEDPDYLGRIGDQWASLANRLDLQEEALHARYVAWHSAPTARRLWSLLHQGAPSPVARIDRMQQEQEALRDNLRVSGRLKALVDALAGDFSGALARLQQSALRAWNEVHHPGQVLFPVILLAGCGMSSPPPQTALASLWNALRVDASDASNEPAELRRPEDEVLLFGALISEVLSHQHQSADERLLLLHGAEAVARERTKWVISRTHPRNHPAVAELVAACAEALILSEQPEKASRLLRESAVGHRRSYAFSNALRRWRTRSPVLPD